MSGTARNTAITTSSEEARAIGLEAYVYLYPLVMMETTRRQMTNVAAGAPPPSGPPNTFSHVRAFPDAAFRAVVRPNFDTLYSTAMLDLTAEPIVMSVPEVGDRYYLLPLYDMWTDAFAVPGSRTTGSHAGHFVVVTRDWRGTLPAGVEVIEAPTPHVWVIGRTQTNGPADYEAVHAVQDGFVLTPLSAFPGEAPPAETTIDPAIDMQTPPLEQVNALSAADLLQRGAELLRLHPPHVTDWSILARLRRIGLRPGERFDVGSLPAAVGEGLGPVAADALALMRRRAAALAPPVNGWQVMTESVGVYGNAYLRRAIVAMAGLGANQSEDAVYPLLIADADGRRLDGSNDYVLHFAADGLPPVGAFWSVTMYDEDGFQVANAIDRFAIGDRDDLVFGADGSLDLYLQHEKPGGGKESNWLPAPRGPLGVTMRLYAPEPQVLDGRWVPPAVRRV